ncbi:MAG: site-specific DNA-methyltransferase [Boseongicola sp. SB0676_bin_33]|nr:site-specific DNA-methyltransferase [Boseongicola sp. SB0676_bin_33]MYK31566.1 site-specific DNA-methyltransferase [Boseongicola sp. SB0670_bin_30]
MRRMDEMGEIWFGTDGSQVPQRKTFLSQAKKGVTPTTLWTHQEAGHNHEASNDLKALGLGGLFDNPKPVRLVRKMLELATAADAEHVVMDFFAGSGTTAHAVIDANEADGGNRRFICVQLPEPIDPPRRTDGASFSDIADIAAVRIRRAGEAAAKSGDQKVLDRGFRRLKLASSNFRAWTPDADGLEKTLLDNVEHLVPGRTDLDILTELLLRLGLDPSASVEKRQIAGKEVYGVEEGPLIACFAENVTRDVVEDLGTGIVAWADAMGQNGSVRVVMNDSGFQDDVAKTNLASILDQGGITELRAL